MTSLEPRLDHLVYATPDLDATIADFAQRYGITATPGGPHEGMGSHNALIALGDATYLELVGPDRNQPQPERPRPFGIDQLTEPRMVSWAIKAPDLGELVERSRAAGYDPGLIRDMSRTRPDGVRLEWRLTISVTGEGDGLIPFLIDWKETPSPATTSVQGWQVTSLRAEHPNPAPIRHALDAMGITLDIGEAEAEAVALIATIQTADTVIELR